ncbi:MAG: lipopolysaccharide biosynthesis protein [Paludibacteraceae bacterium]|nr:lipopolysaccharide biosynthesis protein [Paludibacteraceae bacterium]
MGEIAKQSIRGTIATYLGALISVITTFCVLTRFLTAEEIGLSRTLVDAGTLFIGLAQLGTTSSVIRFYPYFKTEDHKDHGFFFWTIIVPLLGFVLISVLYIILQNPIKHFFEEKSALFVNYFYYVLPLAFFMLYQTVFETNSNARMRIVFPRTVREVIIRLLLLVLYILYAFAGLSLDGFVVSLCGVYAIAALLNIVYLFSTDSISLKPDMGFVKSNPELVRRYLLYTGFLFLSAIASVAAPLISGFFVSAKMGLDYTGIFYVALNMAALVCIPSRSLNAIASPELSQTFKDNDSGHRSLLLKQVSSNLFLIGCFILLAIWINIDLIYHILPNGEIYASARLTVLLLSLSQLLLSAFSIALLAINYSRHYYFSLICSAILTACTIVLNNQLIPLYGINGSALANCLSYIIFFVCVLLVVRIFLHTTPLSAAHLKTLLLTAVLFAANEAVTHFCPELNIWLSSVVRSAVILGLFAAVAWVWRISPDINEYIRKKLKRD